jgi:hypothetical protein
LKDVLVPEEQFGFRLLDLESRLIDPEINRPILLSQLERYRVDKRKDRTVKNSEIVRLSRFKNYDICESDCPDNRDDDQYE